MISTERDSGAEAAGTAGAIPEIIAQISHQDDRTTCPYRLKAQEEHVDTCSLLYNHSAIRNCFNDRLRRAAVGYRRLNSRGRLNCPKGPYRPASAAGYLPARAPSNGRTKLHCLKEPSHDDTPEIRRKWRGCGIITRVSAIR